MSKDEWEKLTPKERENKMRDMKTMKKISFAAKPASPERLRLKLATAEALGRGPAEAKEIVENDELYDEDEEEDEEEDEKETEDEDDETEIENEEDENI